MVYIFINVSGFYFIVLSCMLGEPFPRPLKPIMLAVMHMNSFSHDGCEGRRRGTMAHPAAHLWEWKQWRPMYFTREREFIAYTVFDIKGAIFFNHVKGTETPQQLLDGLPWYFLLTSMVPRKWLWMTLATTGATAIMYRDVSVSFL